MPIEVLMPALSPTMTEGTLSKWVKNEGDEVNAGDVIAEIETDKATMEVEAVDEGKLGKIIVAEGSENVPVNNVIALLLEDGEDAAALESYAVADAAPEVAETEAPAAESAPAVAEDAGEPAQEAKAAVIPDGVTEVLMPALSPTMTEGNLAKWNVKEGDSVSAGDVIAEIETDKATMEVESVDEGVVGKILVDAGTNDVLVNKSIALLLDEGVDKKVLDEYAPAVEAKAATPAKTATKAAPAAKAATATAAAPTSAPTKAPVASGAAPSASNSGKRVKASPLARRLADEAGLDIVSVIGTGPKGRVVKEDVEEALMRGTGGGAGVVRRDASEFVNVPNTGMRKVIAKRLQESKQQVPHFYLSVDCELDDLLAARKQLNDKAIKEAGKDEKPAYKLSVNDLVIAASARALKDVPDANASWYDDAIVKYTNVDVSVAVAIDGGLVTPVIRNADQKTLPQISNEMKLLANKAREGKLLPEEMQGGGFSVSNLGMYGIKQFGAIINPPQSCILAVGGGEQRMVVKNGEPKVATVMTVTLSVDHRSVDGALGAIYLNAFKGYIESPITLFV